MRFSILGFVLSMGLAFEAGSDPAISIKVDMLYPEGIAYHQPTQEFFVSSMRRGTIGTIGRSGQYREFIKNPKLISTVGLHVDAPRNRLLACVSDPGFSIATDPKTQKKLALLLAFDLKTGKILGEVNLGNLSSHSHFCNDMGVAQDGTLYVTDSFAPQIYKITPQYKVSVFVRDDAFKGEGFSLNGIVVHPAGFLLVSKYNDGTLWKIPLKEPKKIKQVNVGVPLPGLDGLVLLSENEIVGIQNNGINKIHKFSTQDQWTTAQILKSVSAELQFPTTGVKVNDQVYVIEGRLDDLMKDPKASTASQFSIKAFKL